MASTNKRILLASTALTATSTGAAVSLDNREVDYVGEIIVSAQHTDTTVDGKIQVSCDGGTNWHDWIVFTQLTASDGKELKLPTSSIPGLSHVRYVATLAGSTQAATVKISLCHRDS